MSEKQKLVTDANKAYFEALAGNAGRTRAANLRAQAETAAATITDENGTHYANVVVAELESGNPQIEERGEGRIGAHSVASSVYKAFGDEGVQAVIDGYLELAGHEDFMANLYEENVGEMYDYKNPKG